MSEIVLGIDVSKKDLSIVLMLGPSYKRCKISNTLKGFEILTAWLTDYGVTKVKACMEATGSYGEEIADYLYEHDHQVHIVNPACIKAFASTSYAL